MVERPILFSGPMVRAILEGRKSQTRRVVKPQAWAYAPDALGQAQMFPRRGPEDFGDPGKPIRCPYGQPGDRLWVRETWCPLDRDGWWHSSEPSDAYYEIGGVPRRNGVAYLADSSRSGKEDEESRRCRLDFGYKWRPSIHMPRRASRISLEVTAVRVERLQDITPSDAVEEGVFSDPDAYTTEPSMPYPIATFKKIWDSINAKRGYPWESNPWVWVLAFSPIAERGADR